MRHVFLVLVRDPSSTSDNLFADTVGNYVILFKIGGRQVKVGKGIKIHSLEMESHFF